MHCGAIARKLFSGGHWQASAFYLGIELYLAVLPTALQRPMSYQPFQHCADTTHNANPCHSSGKKHLSISATSPGTISTTVHAQENHRDQLFADS
jgi:hypothetical protein